MDFFNSLKDIATFVPCLDLWLIRTCMCTSDQGKLHNVNFYIRNETESAFLDVGGNNLHILILHR